MKLALTAATGFIGRYIARHLALQGHRLRCWYRAGSDQGGFEDVARLLEWVKGDLGDALLWKTIAELVAAAKGTQP